MRAIAAFVLMLTVGVASAMPVTVTNVYNVWHLGTWVDLVTFQAGGDGFQEVGDEMVEEYTYRQNEYGTAMARSTAQMETVVTGEGNHSTIDIVGHHQVWASASRGVPDRFDASSFARLFYSYVSFEITEPVLYGGELMVWRSGIDEPYEQFFDGAILGPGRYTTSFDGNFALRAMAVGGQTVYSEASHIYASFDFTHIPVPVPATLGLMLFGLAGITWSRRRAS